ncbi:fasciclin-1 [Lepeophtheirus salmonis]|uniref:FAS1 domain-containing protein n=1 Tax=Lepeophtheirus salmonis TaxID=72036 RepID=A0A0K2UEF0_LEPSM|nr:fasciclin-1-like [Lepeophtheirus salmonis]
MCWNKFLKHPRIFPYHILFLLLCTKSVNSLTMNELMKGRSIDKFKNALADKSIVEAFLKSEITIFAPTDEALEEYSEDMLTEQFILNHMVNINFKIKNDEDSQIMNVPSLLPGSPPLWITSDVGEVFVNGANVIIENLAATSSENRNQILHIIDRPLDPLVPKDPFDSASLIYLSSSKLLKNPESYNLGEFSINIFAEKVKEQNKMGVFEMPGEHTFFIPVDSAFEHSYAALIDEKVINGHIVPNKLLFTRPIYDQEQKTVAYDSIGMKATAIIQQRLSPDSYDQVKSQIVQGTRHHSRGHVISNIIKSNIPVSNGVVHFIDKPLIIIASNMTEYLQTEASKNGRLSRFANYLSTKSPDLFEKIKESSSGTVFAPSNEAFDDMNPDELEELLSDPIKGQKIFGLHFIEQRISSNDIRILQPQNEFGMFSIDCSYPEDTESSIWFYKNKTSNTLIVNAHGISAEVVENDIGATNGVIHVINKVLGISFGSIYEKLSTDPMLTSAFSLGTQRHFNGKFLREDTNFTYIVPTNSAFEKIHKQYLTSYKILFMGDYGYISRRLLERHLLVGESLSTDELVERTVSAGSVQMMRGVPSFRFEKNEDGTVFVLWENVKARIIRANLKCTNGMVHIIDTVIMKKRDIAVSGSTALDSFCSFKIISVFLLLNYVVSLSTLHS